VRWGGSDLCHDCPHFFTNRRVHPVGLIISYVRAVGLDHRHFQPIELAEFLVDRDGGACHSAGEGYRRARDSMVMLSRISPLPLAVSPSFASIAACRPSGPALQGRHPATGFADQAHPAIPHDVVHVSVHQRVRVQCHVEPGQDVDVRRVVQIDADEGLLCGACARLGELDVTAAIVDLVMQA
jgi:hypothetical protein